MPDEKKELVVEIAKVNPVNVENGLHYTRQDFERIVSEYDAFTQPIFGEVKTEQHTPDHFRMERLVENRAIKVERLYIDGDTVQAVVTPIGPKAGDVQYDRPYKALVSLSGIPVEGGLQVQGLLAVDLYYPDPQ